MSKNKHDIEEEKAMVEALKVMQTLGGKMTRKEIRSEIRDNSDVFSEDEVDEVKFSKKSGAKYHPFQYLFNHAVKKLIKSGYFVTEDNRVLELSESGRTVDLNNFSRSRDVLPFLIDNKKSKAKADEIIDDLDDSVDNEPWRDQLLNALVSMSPQKFELFSRGLLKQMGVDIDDEIGIQYVADGGLDGFGYITSDDFRTTRVALQSKRWENKVSTPEIDKFRGAMDKYNAEFGIFITTSDFTREAIKVARQGTRVITLINGDKICDLVAKYQYYVQPVTTYKLGSFYTDKD
ncbi:restriction endonuclease [Apilactobacillus kunkeei]|uniref:restriction endonuclease n=1 Tax=Apilactobacillus kunkeei TaxID=148814 RepID=UPI00059ACFDA|nr:restriction endonuclease [Apilactobacillus kunkeei]KIM18357.1 restriction endonuclease [Apilactobacillus kunkeei]